MRVLTIQLGTPREVQWQGKTVLTSIFKTRISAGASVQVDFERIIGDAQADLAVHGGRDKAVYSFASESYPDWDWVLGRRLDSGAFGENLTTEGFDETDVRIGDRYRIGSALLEVSEPRYPCFKLGIRLGDPGVIKKFLELGRWGVYFRVIEKGEIREGDQIHLETRSPIALTLPELAQLRFQSDPEKIRLALSIPSLSAGWRARLERSQT